MKNPDSAKRDLEANSDFRTRRSINIMPTEDLVVIAHRTFMTMTTVAHDAHNNKHSAGIYTMD